jgi:hypothetical protein
MAISSPGAARPPAVRRLLDAGKRSTVVPRTLIGWYVATVPAHGGIAVSHPRQVIAAAIIGIGLAGCGSSTSSSTGGSQEGGTQSGGGGVASSIDPCVVGTWVATSVITRFSAVGAQVTLTGGAGLTLTFAADGAETADWSSMAPLTTTIPVDVTQTYHGQSHYRVATANGTLSFLSADYAGWSGQQSFGGQMTALVGADPVPAEAYTCSHSTFTEQNLSWQASFARH